MGYDIHITRAEDWANNESVQIAIDEWLALVQGDPELIPTPENGQGFVVWRGATKYPETWFDWLAGNIVTKNPDRATLLKMLKIAAILNAKVQGDDGELYAAAAVDGFDDSYLDGNSHTPAAQSALPNKRVTIIQRLLGRRR